MCVGNGLADSDKRGQQPMQLQRVVVVVELRDIPPGASMKLAVLNAPPSESKESISNIVAEAKTEVKSAAYSVKFSKESMAEVLGAATLTLSVGGAWVEAVGQNNVFAVRVADDGTAEILPVELQQIKGSRPGFYVFEVNSSNGLSSFTLVGLTLPPAAVPLLTGPVAGPNWILIAVTIFMVLAAVISRGAVAPMLLSVTRGGTLALGRGFGSALGWQAQPVPRFLTIPWQPLVERLKVYLDLAAAFSAASTATRSAALRSYRTATDRLQQLVGLILILQSVVRNRALQRDLERAAIRDSVLRVAFTQLQAGFASIQSSWQLVADGYVGHEGKEFQEVRRRIDQGIGDLISMVEELETVAGLRGRMIPSQIEWLRGVNLRDKNVMVSLSPALWTISQELRLPIASAQSAWEVLANGSVKPGDEQFQPVRRAMDYSMRQLTSLMEDLEALVWLQVRMVQLHREPLRVGDLLQKVAAMLQPVLTERRQSLRIEEQTPGLVFEADSRWLTHALTSLVTTISLRGPEGSSILLTGARTNGRVRISTSNPALTSLATQLGASEQQQSFTESEQGDLRMKLCRAVVELHGGTLLVDMTPDEGTLATIELPYVPETFAKI